MAESITSEGKCPVCHHRIVKADKLAKSKTFYAVKSLKIDSVDGQVSASCSQCKTDLVMPVMRISNKIRKPSNA